MLVGPVHSNSVVKQNRSESSAAGMMIFQSEHMVFNEGREVRLWTELKVTSVHHNVVGDMKIVFVTSGAAVTLSGTQGVSVTVKSYSISFCYEVTSGQREESIHLWSISHQRG